MREKPLTERILDPRQNNLGAVGVALKAAAEKKEGKTK